MQDEKIQFDNNNYRIHTDQNKRIIKKSLQDCGAGRSVLIDNNNVLIAGNGVYEQAKELGLPVRVVESSGKELIVVKRTDISNQDEKRKLLALADNHASDTSMFDMEAVLEDFTAEDLDLWEFSLDDLDIENDQDLLDAQDDDYEVPDTSKVKTNIVVGDYFEIGDHRLICGDSTKPETFTNLFKDKKADLVITDPPYNVDYKGGTKEQLTIINDKQNNDDFYQFLFDFYSSLASFVKPGGAWYVWHADSEGANFRSAMKNAGIAVKQCLIWVKNSLVMGRQDYQWQHEPCLYGWIEGAAHKWYSDRKQTTLLEFDRPIRNADHPTMKPVPLISYQLKNSSKKGDIVADGFGGSGTTMVAAHQLKRKCYMIEYDPKYCQVIIDRMLKLDPNIQIKKNVKDYEQKTNTSL